MTSIGILGFAHAHVGSYCRAWAAMPDKRVRVVAGWDHDEARLRKAGEDYGVECCADVDELLQRNDIHAVVVSAETNWHAELVVRAAEARKAIVLQKPMAMSLDEADRMIAATSKHGVPFTLAWQMRVDPQNIMIKDLLDSGAFGQLFMLRRRHGLSCHVWPDFEKSWHVDRAKNVGMWADDAAHAIDFIYWLLGEPESVTAEIDTLRGPGIPDDHGIAIYRYADGVFAEVVSSFTCVAGENTTEIVCENGVIIQNYGDGPSCNVPRPEGAVGLKWYLQDGEDWRESPLPTPANHGDRIASLAEPLLQFLEGKRGPIATAEEGRDVLRMTLACYRASQEGRRLKIAEIGT